MRRRVVLGVIVSSGLLSMGLSAYQQPAAKMVVEAEKLKDNLYVMKGGGGASAVFARHRRRHRCRYEEPWLGHASPREDKVGHRQACRRIINTHTHGDHVSGNVDFPATVDIVVQENTRATMEVRRPVTGLPPPPAGPSIFEQNNGKGLPRRTFKDRMTIGKGADQIDLYYFGPAHTGGDAFVVFRPLRVLHAGDAFANRDLPIMDKNNGGSGVQFSATLAKAAQLKEIDMIINGHNPTTTTMADLKTQSEFIADFVKFVQDAKKSGKTVDDVASTWKTPAKYTGYAAPQPERVKSNAQVIWDETR